MKQSQSGFALLESLLFLIIIAIIGGTGFFVWYSRQNASKSLIAANLASTGTISHPQPVRSFEDCINYEKKNKIRTDLSEDAKTVTCIYKGHEYKHDAYPTVTTSTVGVHTIFWGQTPKLLRQQLFQDLSLSYDCSGQPVYIVQSKVSGVIIINSADYYFVLTGCAPSYEESLGGIYQVNDTSVKTIGDISNCSFVSNHAVPPEALPGISNEVRYCNDDQGVPHQVVFN